jgi:hypothetical protein
MPNPEQKNRQALRSHLDRAFKLPPRFPVRPEKPRQVANRKIGQVTGRPLVSPVQAVRQPAGGTVVTPAMTDNFLSGSYISLTSLEDAVEAPHDLLDPVAFEQPDYHEVPQREEGA